MEIGKPVVVASHPRSGTHLTLDLIRRQFSETKSTLRFFETVHHQYLTLDHLAPSSTPHIEEKEARAILARPQRPLIKTHCLPGYRELGAEHQGFVRELLADADLLYLVRDGRDVICSAHLWMSISDPRARCPLNEFIRQEEDGRSRVKLWADHVRTWLAQPNVHVFRYEDIIKQPTQTLDRLAQVLKLKPLWIEPLLPRPRRYQGRWADYLGRLLRRTESTTIIARPRGQKPQKWRQAFTREDREFFHQEAGDILIELGYERSEAWVEAASTS